MVDYIESSGASQSSGSAQMRCQVGLEMIHLQSRIDPLPKEPLAWPANEGTEAKSDSIKLDHQWESPGKLAGEGLEGELRDKWHRCSIAPEHQSQIQYMHAAPSNGRWMEARCGNQWTLGNIAAAAAFKYPGTLYS